ncbi:MAG: hypothetical protein ACTHK2_09280 [Dokdonella sp.]|uniref:hypothetical protein n=1 Tax=Dokdonella sp. TaxID=2291710 RepID=UPI003F7D2EB0
MTTRAMRLLASGSIASLASTAVVVWASRRHTGYAAAGTNAASQGVFGENARRRRRASVLHTAIGYAIHHASSLLWTRAYCSDFARRWIPSRGARAATVALLAALVDYGVVPRRFTPGFEAHLPRRAIAVVYAAFGAGLWLSARVHDPGRRRSARGRAPRAH